MTPRFAPIVHARNDSVAPSVRITHRVGLWQAAQKPVRLGSGFCRVRRGVAEGDALRVRSVFLHLDVDVTHLVSPRAMTAQTLCTHHAMRPGVAHNGRPHASGRQGIPGKRTRQGVLHNVDVQYTFGRAVSNATHSDPLAAVPEGVVAHLAVRVLVGHAPVVLQAHRGREVHRTDVARQGVREAML